MRRRSCRTTESRALTRRWGRRGRPEVAFIALNPSTADAAYDDPTIRRCIGFARSWGYRRLVVVNLFAFCATKPEVLFRAEDPVGPRNDAVLRQVARDARKLVACWGVCWKSAAQRAQVGRRVSALLSVVRQERRRLYAIETSAGGHPRHPLYLRSGCTLSRWRPVAE